MSSSAAHRDLARWLLQQEMGQATDEHAPAVGAERVCRNLYKGLAPLVTTVGSQAFLSRSLHLARAEFPFLDGLRAGMAPDACFEGLDETLDGVEAQTATDAFVEVFANMIGLLVAFIGEGFALHVIRNSWPGAQLGPGGEGIQSS